MSLGPVVWILRIVFLEADVVYCNIAHHDNLVTMFVIAMDTGGLITFILSRNVMLFDVAIHARWGRTSVNILLVLSECSEGLRVLVILFNRANTSGALCVLFIELMNDILLLRGSRRPGYSFLKEVFNEAHYLLTFL